MRTWPYRLTVRTTGFQSVNQGSIPCRVTNMTEVIILAAGKGTRMKDVLPKALVKVNDRPMILYSIEAVQKTGLGLPIIVVSDNECQIREVIGNHNRYVRQEQQLGTGHAVKTALTALKKETNKIIVLYCDHPLVTTKTLNSLIRAHEKEKSVLTMAVAQVEDFNEWRNSLYSFGRIIRNKKGDILAVVEKKDATQEQLLLTEVNPAYFCFDRKWLEEAINKITNYNSQKEYYLTDLVNQAVKENKKITDVVISAEEALGANTKEEILLIKKLLSLPTTPAYPRTL